jgi:hypothetical protein
MTKRATATQAQVRRNIKAARLEGLRIAGIRPDGTLIVYDGDIPLSPNLDISAVSSPKLLEFRDFGLDEQAASISKWGDIEA